MSLLYQFMDKKHSEGSSYKVYMMASANKFLRICYAFITVKVNTLAQIQLVLNTSLVNRLCIFELFGGLASCGLFRNRSIIPRTGKEKSLENGARKV